MRHASIQTIMNGHDGKRQAHSKVVEGVVSGGKPGEKVPTAAIGSLAALG